MEPQQLYMMLPGLQQDELYVLQSLMKDMTDKQRELFISIYQGKRKDQQTMLIFTLIGFLGVAGIQRFVIGEVVMGILYLLTCGFCGIGTIIDAIDNRNMTANFNQKQALESEAMVRMMGA